MHEKHKVERDRVTRLEAKGQQRGDPLLSGQDLDGHRRERTGQCGRAV